MTLGNFSIAIPVYEWTDDFQNNDRLDQILRQIHDTINLIPERIFFLFTCNHMCQKRQSLIAVAKKAAMYNKFIKNANLAFLMTFTYQLIMME